MDRSSGYQSEKRGSEYAAMTAAWDRKNAGSQVHVDMGRGFWMAEAYDV